MLHALIAIDLPSAETNRSMGPVEWVRSLFGAQLDLRSGKEKLTVSALSLVEGIALGFKRAGVTDLISFLVDRRVVYADVNNEPDDLRLLLTAADESGLLDKPFREMHLALSLVEDGLHVVFDVGVANEVVLGGEEMAVKVTARPEALRVSTGETAIGYAERVRDYAASPTAFDDYRLRLDQIVARVAASLHTALVGSTVRTELASATLLRPEARQVARFRQLPFGDATAPATYRAVPARRAAGYYDDPFHYYYYDPYYDFTNWLLVDSLVHGSAPGFAYPYVQIVDPAGATLGNAAEVAAGVQPLADNGASDSSSVAFSTDGGLWVSESIPDAPADTSSFLSGETGWGTSDAGSSGWGSSDSSSSDSGGWGSSDSSSSDSSSASSCSSSSSSCSSSSSSCSSSSCSSSSCGSSSCGSS